MTTTQPQWQHIDWDSLSYFDNSDAATTKHHLSILSNSQRSRADEEFAIEALIPSAEYARSTTIPTSTVPIFDFCLSLLPDNHYQARPYLLARLHNFYSGLHWNRRMYQMSMQYYSLMSACFMLLKQHRADIAAALHSGDTDVRREAVLMADSLADFLPEFVPILLEAHPDETCIPDLVNDRIRTLTRLCESHRRTVFSHPEGQLDATHRDLFEQIHWFARQQMERHPLSWERRPAVELSLASAVAPVADDVIETLLWFMEHPRQYVSYMRNPQAYSTAQMVQLLSHPSITPQKLHEQLYLYTYELRIFTTPARFREDASGTIRMKPMTDARQHSAHYNTHRQQVLDVILNCDPFWQQPSDFLEVVFGKHYDRDDLALHLAQ